MTWVYYFKNWTHLMNTYFAQYLSGCSVLYLWSNVEVCKYCYCKIYKNYLTLTVLAYFSIKPILNCYRFNKRN